MVDQYEINIGSVYRADWDCTRSKNDDPGHVDPQSETYQNTAITEHTNLSKYTNFVNDDYLINNSFFSVGRHVLPFNNRLTNQMGRVRLLEES